MLDNLEFDRNIQQFLQEGNQTQITSIFKEVANKLKKEPENLLIQILHYLHAQLRKDRDRELKGKIFRKRTADQILKDGFTTGCTDYALVFITLARAMNIPTKYIEAIEKDSPDGMRGHVFAECYLNGRWEIVDPTRGQIYQEYDYPGFDIIAEGLDSWDVGTGSEDEITQKTLEFRRIQNQK